MDTEERLILIAFEWVAGLLGLLLFYFSYIQFRHHRATRKLELEKLNASIIATEIQRNSIATELHNDIGPYLSSVKMRLDLVKTNDLQEILSCQAALDKCIDQIRGMAKVLSPLSIFEISFQEALAQYIKEVNIKNELKITLIELDHPLISPEQNNQLYRILQEIIQNTIKHAQATLLHIEISVEDKMLLIRTSDNGIGYDLSTVRTQNKLGLGLLGIHSRIDYLNGTLVIDDKITTGTKYNIRIPIKSNS